MPARAVTLKNTPEAWSERALEQSPWTASLWSEHGQNQRFLAVLRHLHLRDGDTVLDYGCGSGRLCEFLPAAVTYYAYDTSPGMLERVRRDYARAWVLDEMPNMAFDHIVCIGCFNLADNWSKELTWECLEQLLVSSDTLVVSLYRGHDTHCLHYEAAELAEFAQLMSCSSFAIDATYLSNDLLLKMRA